jgi:hypothetical protein
MLHASVDQLECLSILQLEQPMEMLMPHQVYYASALLAPGPVWDTGEPRKQRTSAGPGLPFSNLIASASGDAHDLLPLRTLTCTITASTPACATRLIDMYRVQGGSSPILFLYQVQRTNNCHVMFPYTTVHH